jgi:mutator protein MutT
MRSAVIIMEHNQIALIERVRDGQTYYLFPGGTIEAGETSEAAAIREAAEELGVTVILSRLAAVITFHNNVQFHYHATITTESASQFGMGTGDEYTSNPIPTRGSYRPIWLNVQDLAHYDVRPQALVQALLDGTLQRATQPLQLQETR